MSLLKNTAWGFAGEFVARVAKLGQVFVMVRVLGPSEIGLYNHAFAFASLFSVFFDFGIVTVAVREETKTGRTNDAYAHYGRLKAITCSLGWVALLVWGLAGSKLSRGELLLAVLLGSQLVMTEATNYAFVRFRSTREFWKETAWRTFFSVVQLVAVLAMLWLRPNPVGVAAGLIGGTLISLVPFLRELSGIIGDFKGESWARFRRSALECAPLAGAVLVGSIYMNLDVVSLGRWATMAEVGQYSVAVKTVFGMLIMPLAFLQTASLPHYAADVGSAGSVDEAFRERWLRGFVLSSTAGAVICLATALGSWLIVSLLFGSQFRPAAPVLTSFTAAGYLFYVYTPLSQWLLILGKQRWTLYAQALAAAVNVAAVYLFIPKLGVAGATLAAGATHSVMALAHVWLVRRHGGFTGREAGWAPLVRVTGALGAALIVLLLGREHQIAASAMALGLFVVVSFRELVALAANLRGRMTKAPRLTPA